MNDFSVSVAKIAQILDLKNFTDNIDLKKIKITSSDVNRPALQLTGYFAHFEQSRIQMIGNVEYAYIQQMSDEEKRIRYSAFLQFEIPCVIFCRDLQPDAIFIEQAEKNHVPILGTSRPTSEFMAELIYTLAEKLAPSITVHGVLVDVYGEGLMITGDSGIGKSEAALELIRRGHRLDQLIIYRPQEINHRVLLTAGLDAADNLMSILPFLNKSRDKFHRILKITAHTDRAIPRRLTHRVKRRIKLPKIGHIKNSFNLFIFCTQLLKLRSRSVRRTVINKQNLIIILRQSFLQYIYHCKAHEFYIFDLIKAWNDNTDFFHIITSLSLMLP